MTKVCALLLAAGRGVRFGNNQNKLFAKINGEPVWYYSANLFDKHKDINQFIIVVHPNEVDLWNKAVSKFQFEKLYKIVKGGDERSESSKKGLKALDPDTDIVLIHDTARPLITNNLISRLIKKSESEKAVIPAILVTDTIKVGHIGGYSQQTLTRSELVAVQTPQVFQYKTLMDAYENCAINKEFTDDAMLLESFGIPIYLLEGESANIKITRQSDIALAEYLINSKNLT